MQLLALFAPFLLALPVSCGSDYPQHIGEWNMSASDIFVCPDQPKAIDLLCGGTLSSDRNGPMRACYARDDKGCDPNSDELFQECFFCICRHGRFICDELATVPGGQSSLEYAEDVGCHCNG